MSFPVALPPIDHRPTIQRSRSHTGSTVRNTPNTNGELPSAATKVEAHSTNNESKSHLSPTDSRPRNSNALPTHVDKTNEKTSRLHLPGSHLRHHQHHENDSSHKRHRYTQSEAQHLQRSWNNRDDRLPHLVAGLNAERDKRAAAINTTQGSDKLGATDARSGLTKQATTKLQRGGLQHAAGDAHYLSTLSVGDRHGLRRRATSDPKPPTQAPTQRPKTEIEIALERADRAKLNKRRNVKQEDLDRRSKQLEEADNELRDRIAEINFTGAEVTRRLDYTYYNLLEKAGDLVTMISNFQSLSKESQQLITNFDSEASKLDQDIRRRIGNFKTEFDRRTNRGETLEKRGKASSNRAEELVQRLENARSTVEAFIEKEMESRKVWLRFWAGIWWTVGFIVVLILIFAVGKEWWFQGDPVKAGLKLPVGGHTNSSLALGQGGKGDDLLARARLPDEVRSVLTDIESRNKAGKKWFGRSSSRSAREPVTTATEAEAEADRRLELLDEL